jgi:hypothetical protein
LATRSAKTLGFGIVGHDEIALRSTRAIGQSSWPDKKSLIPWTVTHK